MTQARIRRWGAWLTLAAVLAFAGLDAVHTRDLQPVTPATARPCLICQLAASARPAPHAIVGPAFRMLLASAPLPGERSLPQPAARGRAFIRPPPAFPAV